MLEEIKNVRQVEGESKRRWFTDDYFDLIVWEDENGEIGGFQLCYDKPGKERALTWRRAGGYCHNLVDNGEAGGFGTKLTPILIEDGIFDFESVAVRFKKHRVEIEESAGEFVYRKITDYPKGRIPPEIEPDPE